MKKIENKEKVSMISFTRTIQPFCPLGSDHYNAQIEVDFIPGESYPDYCEADKKIKELGGETYTIEQLAEVVYNMMQEFEPIDLTVTIRAESNTHFPVTVIKGTEAEM